jgi:uncharacterized membrane protein (DUF2068 family)
MQQHVKILGWCFIIYSGLLLLLAGFLFLIISGAGVLSGDRQAMLVTGAVGTFIAALFLVLALPGLITGFGLLKYRPWARIVAIVLGAINLLSVPVGTALGVYTLWVLLNAQTTALFEQSRVTSA